MVSGAYCFVQGINTMALGVGGSSVSMALTSTGAGSAIGIPAGVVSGATVAAGAAVTTFGGALTYSSASNFKNNWEKFKESKSRGGNKGASESGKNGVYEKADYHGKTNNSVKNKAPNKGQEALDNSIPIGKNTTRRVGISDGEIVVFDETTKGVFHGHVRSWSELSESMKAALRKTGMVTKKGKIIK